jgi:5'-nucleotidase
MRILISNDDGYQADGIIQLANSLSEIAEVIVVAPSENKSAASSSLTIGKPLKPIQIKKNVYAIDATPSDCVHLALCGFIKESIDLVVTGINFGANLGDDVIYSGTVAGAIEGRFLGLPSIAMSLASWECKHFDTAGDVAKLLVAQIDKAPLAYNTIINVNVPDVPMSEIKGIKSTRLGNRHKSEPSIQDLKDPSLYWIGENGKEADNGEGTDFHAVSNNFVSVTPLQIDLTKYPELKQVSEWLEDIDY